MTELALAVDADDELWTLDTLPTPEAPYVLVGSELVGVRSRFPSQTYTLTGQELPPRIRVRRGIAGTTKAAHDQGSALTPNYGLEAGGGGGGGSLTLDNTVDPPAEVATIIAVGAVISGDEATLPLGSILTDPGALWEAEHEYVTGDRILVWDTVVFEAQDDGLSGAIEPEWDIVVAIADGDISAWTPLGELGELDNGLMPLGLGDFALTAPSAILASADIAIATHNTDDVVGDHPALVDAIVANVEVLVSDHAALQGAHHILSGAADPSAGGGVAASSGDIYVRTNGQLWMKFGPTDTEWRCVSDPTAFWLDSSGDVMTNALFPTADPAVIGKLWADAGTLKVSAG